jgi:acyl-CoA thioester hydrolase
MDARPDALPETLPALGSFEGSQHFFVLRVYFEDTDLTGVVYHANYLRFMERARSDMLVAAGIDQRAAHEGGEGAYAIRNLAIKYRTPARLGDELTVISRLIRLRPAAVDIHQRVMLRDTIVTEAEVEAAFVAPSGRPRRQPPGWIAAFEPLVWKGH